VAPREQHYGDNEPYERDDEQLGKPGKPDPPEAVLVDGVRQLPEVVGKRHGRQRYDRGPTQSRACRTLFGTLRRS